MDGKTAFRIWSRHAGVWAPWISPVLFVQFRDIETAFDVSGKAEWLPDASETALILDLPGATSLSVANALQERGFAVLPIFNASPPPDTRRYSLVLSEASVQSPAVVDVEPLLRGIRAVTAKLQDRPPQQPVAPAFLLDSNRLASMPTKEKYFDNRWMVFPQDFPSAKFLKAQRIHKVLLVQESRMDPLDDLAHVLRRWQDEGIEIHARTLRPEVQSKAITVNYPSRYKAMWYRALAIMGLRRNASGGFGDYVPESSSAG